MMYIGIPMMEDDRDESAEHEEQVHALCTAIDHRGERGPEAGRRYLEPRPEVE